MMINFYNSLAKLLYVLRIGILLFFVFSCKEGRQAVVVDESKMNELLLQANKNLIHFETNAIDSFVLSHSFNMEVTGSGLRYEIIKKENGRKPKVGDELMIRYKSWLLDGTLCEETQENIPQILILGKGVQIKGVEEMLLLMSAGETARMIVPAHLAYGMRGDGKIIPPQSSLYYEINLIAIKE